MEISQDFKEWLELLNANKVEYVIVGAHALAFYGVPRFTGDLDILVKPSQENAKKVIQTLEAFGFGPLKLRIKDFTEPDSVIQLGYPPVRIDLITTLTGLTWQQIETGKTKGHFGPVEVYFLGKKDLIRNKKTLGRKKDLADLEALEGPQAKE